MEKNLAVADELTHPFQEAMTTWCRLFGWGDNVIGTRTRSMGNLATIGALGKPQEWQTYGRAVLNKGFTREEIGAIIHAIGIYCGVPRALGCFRVARRVLDET